MMLMPSFFKEIRNHFLGNRSGGKGMDHLLVEDLFFELPRSDPAYTIARSQRFGNRAAPYYQAFFIKSLARLGPTASEIEVAIEVIFHQRNSLGTKHLHHPLFMLLRHTASPWIIEVSNQNTPINLGQYFF